MAGRKYFNSMCRRATRRTALIALVALCLVGASVMNWRQAAAKRRVNSATVTPLPPASGTSVAGAGSLVSLNGREFPQSDGEQGVVIGEFEGNFDANTRSFSLRTISAEKKGNRLMARSDPNTEAPIGPGRVVRSQFVNTPDTPATISGEIELTNSTNATLYNTRVVFTTFKVANAGGADAGNLPGASGFAFFNDGQVAYGGKLNVSRAYGDIAAGGKVSQIWTFAVNNTPPNFFFAYKVIADLGVAAESVAPAAVQVSASTGTSVTINGRGFTGTPTVELLGGATVALTGVTATATSITATVPAGTAPGIYSVRVTNPGGTAGGAGSSTVTGRLTVTDVPSAANTLSGAISAGSLAGSGPYLISGNSTLSASTPIAGGTVIYVAAGATIVLDGGGNISANGGVPGVPSTSPAQVVITAQRAPGAAIPATGFWGGINATAPATSMLNLRNVVIEYGGTAAGAGINLSGSGRTLRFTDGILRGSGGPAILAPGTDDSVVGFSRNRVENNGASASDPAMVLSGNASLGLFDLAGSGASVATSVGDASYYYSSANEFSANQPIQIGITDNVASNDFTKSGVLVGQGTTPIRIAGNCANPAIVGADPATPAELTIGPAATIQLAADLNFQAGDYATNRVGCIAANGYAGVYLGSQAGSAAANKLISFDKIPSGGNFGAIYFARNAMANCILNYVSVQNGGSASACSLGNGEVIAEVVGVKITNSQINNSATGGLLASSGAIIDTRNTTSSGNAFPIIDTIAGGILGDGNDVLRVNMVTPVAVAIDPLGRGIFIVDATNAGNLIRFVNTSRNSVTIGGQKIPGGVVRTLIGGGLDPADNVPGRNADAGSVTGLAISNDGQVIYFIDSGASIVRAYNASNAAKSIGGQNIGAGNVGTLATEGFGSSLNALAVHPTTGEVYIGDATAGNNKIFKVAASGGLPTAFAGSGAVTKAEDAFSSGAATSVPLLQPRGFVFDPQGNLYIADTGHARIIKVDTGGNATLVAQFPPKNDSGASPYKINPFTTGLAFTGGKLYAANGNTQDIIRIDGPGNYLRIVGIFDESAGSGSACDYQPGDVCGDGGDSTAAGLNMIGSTGTPPLAGIAADSKGIYVLDQGGISRGRVRFINLSAADVEVAGTLIAPNNINTIAGSGLTPPFDNGLATSAAFNTPSGVGVDANGNLWITDTLTSRLRFVNRGTSPITIFAGTEAEQTVAPGNIVSVNKDVGSGNTDGVPVNQAGFDTPQGLAITAQGIFIADAKKGGSIGSPTNRRTAWVRFVNTTGQTVEFYSGGAFKISVPAGGIATIVGGSTSPTSVGDGDNPLSARLIGVTDVAIHPTSGDIYIADAGNYGANASTPAPRLRRVNRSTGAISTILTGGASDAYVGLSFDSQGRLLVANAGRKTTTTAFGNSTILREKSSGLCATTPTGCFDTILNGGLLKNPRDVAEGLDGALYVTNAGPSEFNRGDHKILRIVVTGSTGTATVFAGTDEGYSGDGGPAAMAQLRLAADDFNVATVGNAVNVRANMTITVAPNGEIIFTDSKNNAIRRIR